MKFCLCEGDSTLTLYLPFFTQNSSISLLFLKMDSANTAWKHVLDLLDLFFKPLISHGNTMNGVDIQCIFYLNKIDKIA